MRLVLPLYIMVLTLLFSACDKELTSPETQPLVKYIIIVTDSTSGEPLDSVEISITTVFKETNKFRSESKDGRIELDEVESFWNKFSVSRPGFGTRDFIDTVREQRDSLFDLPILRVLEVKLVKNLGADSTRIQIRIIIRDIQHGALTRGRVHFRDRFSIEKIGEDFDEDGIIGLGGMAKDRQRIRIEHPGFLGRQIDVTPTETSSNLDSVPNVTVNLQALSSSVSGRVFKRVPGQGNLPLGGARLVFELSGDSLVFPRQFEGFSHSGGDSIGYYRLDSLPEMAGVMKFFLDGDASEPSEIKDISLRQVQLARLLDNVVLDAVGQSGAPIATLVPPDTVSPSDSLLFRFNLPVDTVKSVVLREINSTRGLLAQHVLDSDHKIMRVFLKGETFKPGIKYEYVLDLRTGTGETFVLPGSDKEIIQGQVQIRVVEEPPAQVLFPQDFRFTYFSSGKLQNFHPQQDETSPLADSTSNMARLQWAWPAQGAVRADSLDSLMVAFKDTHNNTQWKIWRTFPARGDSLPLFFSEIYSTAGFPDAGKSLLPPLKSGGDTLRLQVIPKHKDHIHFDREILLPPVTRAMGPSLWARYTYEDTLFIGPQAGKDTIRVTFLSLPGDTNSVFTLDTAALGNDAMGERIAFRKPAGVNVSVATDWEWINAHSGRLIYNKSTASETLHGARFSVDVTGTLSQGKPLWQRNRFTAFVELRQ